MMNLGNGKNWIDIVSKCIKEFQEKQGPIIKGLNEVVQHTKEAVKDLNIAFTLDELEQAVKIAWNYQEESCKLYTFEKAIAWFKENLDKNIHSAGCIYKESTPTGFVLHLCFMNSEKKPLLMGDCPHKVVSCYSMDEALTSQFGDKDLIILQ